MSVENPVLLLAELEGTIDFWFLMPLMGGDAAGGCDEEDWGNISPWFLVSLRGEMWQVDVFGEY